MLKNLLYTRLRTLALTASIAISVQVNAKENPVDHSQHQLMGSHGMVVFQDNQQNLVVSHLPLYVSPHDYQIVYRARLANNENTDKNTLLIKNLFDKGMVTVLPKNFHLSKLINGDTFTVGATFFEGHFERGGKPAFNADMTFTKQILAKQIVKNDHNQNNSQQSEFYITAINNNQSLYLHKIQTRPSFDAIGIIDTPKEPSVTCKKVTELSVPHIMSMLSECGLSKPIYLETQDFS